jgi:hypothetical protein
MHSYYLHTVFLSAMVYSLYILPSLNTLKINTSVCVLSEVLAKFTVIFAKIFALYPEVSFFESRPTTEVSHVTQESIIK